MRCKRCGSEIQDGDMFCGNCGWKVEEKKKPVIPIIIGIVVVVLIAVIGIFWYLHHQGQKKVEENLAKFQERVEEGKKESESDQADTRTRRKQKMLMRQKKIQRMRKIQGRLRIRQRVGSTDMSI